MVLCTFSVITTTQQPFYGPLSRTTRVSRYQKKHSPTQHPDHHPIFISFFHLPWSTHPPCSNYVLGNLFAQPLSMSSFGLSLGLEPSTSYSIHFLTESMSSFCNTCPYHRNLFCCSINIISSIPSLSLNSLLRTLSFTWTLHIHLTARLVPPHFLSWQARSHFRVAHYFARNCYTASLS